MTCAEVLAIGRLRQWAAERSALKSGRTFNYNNPGRPNVKARTNRYDAALVRIIDFERAIASLPVEEQTALVLTYRDKQDTSRVADAVGCSVRKLCYLIPRARQHLADELDKLDLL
jgi:DNA-directed RNA polymerase specialized sigma24 family protein